MQDGSNKAQQTYPQQGEKQYEYRAANMSILISRTSVVDSIALILPTILRLANEGRSEFVLGHDP